MSESETGSQREDPEGGTVEDMGGTKTIFLDPKAKISRWGRDLTQVLHARKEKSGHSLICKPAAELHQDSQHDGELRFPQSTIVCH